MTALVDETRGIDFGRSSLVSATSDDLSGRAYYYYYSRPTSSNQASDSATETAASSAGNHPMKLMTAPSRSTLTPVNFRPHTSRSTPIRVVQSPSVRRSSTSAKPTNSLRPTPTIPFMWVTTATGRKARQRWCWRGMVQPHLASVVMNRSR